MPYAVKKQGGSKPYKIVRKDTGKTVGSSTSRPKANASVRKRQAGENSR